MTTELEKISGAESKLVLKTASATIRSLASENDALRQKVAAFEERTRVEKIAKAMEEKGLNADLDYTEKVAALLDKERTPNLDTVEEAVKMASPQGRILGELGDGVSSGKHPFENYILTGESPD